MSNTDNNEIPESQKSQAQVDATQGDDIPAEANLPGQQEGFQGGTTEAEQGGNTEQDSQTQEGAGEDA